MNLAFIILVAGAGLGLGGYWALRRRRIEALLSAPLPAEYRRVLRARVPVYNALPHDLRRRLDGLVNRFLAEKKFYGQGGLEVTDEMRVVIAAQACLLIVNKENRWYNTLETIHVYPAVFTSRIRRAATGLWFPSTARCAPARVGRAGPSFSPGTRRPMAPLSPMTGAMWCFTNSLTSSTMRPG